MERRSSRWSDIDWIIVSLYGILVLMGWFNIYAATFNEEHQSIFDISQLYGKQMLWIATSCFLAWVILMLDPRFFSRLAYPIYGFCIFLLIAVLVVGTEIKGAKSWFTFGGFSFQPSEIAKFGTSLALTFYLSTLGKRFSGLLTRLKAMLILILPAALILLQPDTGSVLVYASFIFVMYREGLSGNILLIGLGGAVLFVVALLLNTTTIELPYDIVLPGQTMMVVVIGLICLVLYAQFKKIKQVKWVILGSFLVITGYIFAVNYAFNNILQKHQQARINELLGIESDPTGAGYNVHQSMIAIGSGGGFGKGFLQGTQTKYDFVPEQSTDFIFCTVGEEWGFIGTFTVIFLFVYLLFRIIIVAERQRSKFSRIYGYCVASIFFFHLAINVGMTIGLAPVIGIPLPFFSYGGSSLWSFTILLFTFIKMDSERMHILR
ncbi:MAG: rod shape-determining protein RodA [Crocinitomicaceae bacterium]|nr:rod shape-determining protein RodA [Crocinitomicaceae bacterium]